MAMSNSAMKAKIAAAYNTRTGLSMDEGDFNVLIDICQGIIEEIISNSTVTGTVTITSGSSVGTFPIDPGAKVNS